MQSQIQLHDLSGSCDIELARDFLKMDMKAVKKFFIMVITVAMPNSKLHAKFQLNIFIFVARASLRTLVQSMKQKRQKVGPEREFLGQFFKLFSRNKYAKTGLNVVCNYAQQ